MAGVANATVMMPMYQGTQEVNSIPDTSDSHSHDSIHGQPPGQTVTGHALVDNQMTACTTHESQEQILNQSEQQPAQEPVIDIVINNVVCTFATKCHLNLKRIAMDGVHVIYKRENGVSILLYLYIPGKLVLYTGHTVHTIVW